MRAVADEQLLDLLRAAFALDEALRLREGGGPSACVPGHGEEHQSNQRHLGELVPVGVAPRHEAAQHRARDQDDHGQHDGHTAHRPALEPVDDGQADPHQVERHGLQVGYDEQQQLAAHGEQHPAGEDETGALSRH
ncbi:hypothetical protein ACFSL4_23370 [Streptomyces caeni]|uniref:Uncharacterized protein n=1 Tax=Streptomyces caeni TaxID=2307231 RepID=A0ABW4IYK3_9ACTN